MKHEDEFSFSFPISFLLAPSAGVDAAPLGPHEVLACGEQSVVQGVGVEWGRVHRGRVHQLGHGGGGAVEVGQGGESKSTSTIHGECIGRDGR